MKNKKANLLITIVIILLIIVFLIFILSISYFPIIGNAIDVNIHADAGKTNLDANLNAEGPYSFPENFIMICFGFLILAIAYFIIKYVHKNKK